MVGWHHRLSGHAAAAAKSPQWCPTLCDPNRHEFEQTPGDSGRQSMLTCYSPWGHKELDTT